jgi:hypothetical protein
MNKSDVIKTLTEFREKYHNLVWLARKDPAWLRDGHPSMPAMVAVQMKYPKESEDLEGEDGDWYHGFNSGCLAAFRLAIDLLCTRGNGQEDIEEFPFLDT